VARLDLRRVALAAGGLALLAVLTAGVVAVFAVDRGGAPGRAQPLPEDGVAASASLQPRIVLFGDTVIARVDVVVDTSAMDPDAVRITWSPTPWKLVRPPDRTVTTADRMAHVRTRYVLRCLTRECAPVRPTEQIAFEAARVVFRGAGATDPTSERVAWPLLLVHSRVGEVDAGQRDVLASPWRADLVSLPAVTYRIAPGAAITLLVLLAVVLFGIAAVVTYRAWPRREPEPEPEPPPAPVASPLEQALALLESHVAVNGSEGRRRALELVADEVERVGDAELALAARALAWSPHDPDVPATRALAVQLRERLEANGVPA